MINTFFLDGGNLPPIPTELVAGRSSGWEKLQHITVMSHPFCSVCGVMKNLQVHHKLPFHLFPELELDPKNLIVLCLAHHFLFGHLLDWRAYNPNVDQDVVLWNKKIKDRVYNRE